MLRGRTSVEAATREWDSCCCTSMMPDSVMCGNAGSCQRGSIDAILSYTQILYMLCLVPQLSHIWTVPSQCHLMPHCMLCVPNRWSTIMECGGGWTIVMSKTGSLPFWCGNAVLVLQESMGCMWECQLMPKCLRVEANPHNASKEEMNGKLHSSQTKDYSSWQLCSLNYTIHQPHFKQWWTTNLGIWSTKDGLHYTWMISLSMPRQRKTSRTEQEEYSNDWKNTIFT